jgi:hypothetical protein
VFQKLIKRFDSVAALQLFQLLRYGTLILLGIFFAKIGVPKSSIASLESLIFISGLVSFFWVNSCIQLLLSEYANFNEIDRKKSIFRYFITFQLFSVIASIAVYFGTDNAYSSTIAIFILFGYTKSIERIYSLLERPEKDRCLRIWNSDLFCINCVNFNWSNQRSGHSF